jgi:hypothetical protein
MKRFLRMLTHGTPPWWFMPGLLVSLATVTLLASWSMVPHPDELCYFLDTFQFGDECGMVTLTGNPCPQCGMTRSFAWGARGHLVKAFWYNPGGLSLFLWIQAGGVVGLARLVTRDAERWSPPFNLLAFWTLFWALVVYAAPWALRVLFDVNPLPV